MGGVGRCRVCSISSESERNPRSSDWTASAMTSVRRRTWTSMGADAGLVIVGSEIDVTAGEGRAMGEAGTEAARGT